MVSQQCTKQAQMPMYFAPHDVCFCTTLPKSNQWNEIGKWVKVLATGKFLLVVFADGVW